MALINRTDIQVFRQISNSVYDDVLNQHILDAQFVDLQDLMGMDFYNDLIRNSASVENTSLLDGGTYTYNGITYTNVGLKAVLSHYAYARYIMFGSQTDTPFGFVEKSTQESNAVSEGGKKTMFKMNQQTAYKYWENVVAFLNRKAVDYPLWKNGCIQTKSTFRISKIG
jgi:hypothetical protein